MQFPSLHRTKEVGGAPPVEIFCDFDGTITTCDVTDRLLEELADPQWKEIETAWENGQIGSRECMAQQVALIRGGWQAMQRVLDTVQLEPSFKPFVDWCRDKHITLHVVSDGLDRVINYLLDREGIKIGSIVANRLVEATDGSFSLQFPYSVADKFCTSGVCKCKFLADVKSGAQPASISSNLLSRMSLGLRQSSLSSKTKPTKIVIGDGRSDFCWANEADLVFAKAQLLEYCKDKRLHYVALKDFVGVADYTENYLLSPSRAAAPAAEHLPGLATFGLQSIA